MYHNKKNNILSLSQNNLSDLIIQLNIEKFRNKQIWQWLYQKGVDSFFKMSNLNKKTQQILDEKFTISRPNIKNIIQSQDKTCKWLISFSDCKEVETVFIPEENRATLCISSQVGCTLSCKFCHTGTQTLVRNLSFDEIIAQILVAKDHLQDWEKNKITHIVFMGMGEPFFNYEEVKKAIHIINDKDGLNFSLNKITVSTSGLSPEIIKSASELKTNLAISLHATNNSLRSEIMAINKKYPLENLMQACKIYQNLNPKQKITFEYTLLNQINDRQEQALELVKLIKKYNLNVRVNLIPFNMWQGVIYQPSSIETIKEFQKILKQQKIIATIRKTRGEEVLAACGQLKSESIRLKSLS
ncbi:MAG: 23S rRNA (adenine(2503)-C(2))-methyltransferase RlmN [Proteobacteria bacterium]|nr:23S rRNA (adenine(2503)-C(2))-methyltransferase RlmN [Pseudomonadota bacterium]